MQALKLCLVLSFGLVACKARDEAGSPAASTSQAALAQRKLEIPRDQLVAASTHLRFIDAGQGQVVAGLQLGRSITDLAFAADGQTVYVAASDGVRAVDLASRRVAAKLSDSPARQLTLSNDGASLDILEHDVPTDAHGVRVPGPYRLTRVALREGGKRESLPIGERVLGVVGPDAGAWSLVMFETGEVRVLTPAEALSATGRALDLSQDLDGRRYVVRPYFAVSPDRNQVFVPVEGTPSRVVRFDRRSGEMRTYPLGRSTILRGIAVSPADSAASPGSADGGRLYVSTSDKLLVVDLREGSVVGELALDGAHTGLELSADGRRAYLAQTVFEKGGAITAVSLDPLKLVGKIATDDISPWVLGVVPRAELANR